VLIHVQYLNFRIKMYIYVIFRLNSYGKDKTSDKRIDTLFTMRTGNRSNAVHIKIISSRIPGIEKVHKVFHNVSQQSITQKKYVI
jgi:hypothetical protein